MKIPPRLSWLGVILLLASCSSSDLEFIDPENTTENTTGDATDALMLPRLDVREITEITPYRANSPYASVLRECALVENLELACTLTELPFIAQANPTVTRDDILDRVLVTHTWMGDRFESLLNDAPDMMIPLFGSVTSIVIGSTVRPSNYWAGTGSIQLDPAGLWLSVLEKSNVSVTEDYRAEFADELQFWYLEALRLGREEVETYSSLTDREERSYDDIKIPIYRLLYHELAHAVNFLPPESIPMLNASLLPVDALILNEEFFLSPRLIADLPLLSQPLFNIGQVSFQGDDAGALEKSYTPAFLGNEMSGDGSAKLYAYSSIREDFSTVFTLAMMKFSFNIDLYNGFVNKPVDQNNFTCDDLLVGWGEKNRLADPLVLARARWALDSVYGVNPSIDSFFATGIGQAEPMIAGVNWCANRDDTLLADFPTGSESQTPTTADDKKAGMQQLLFERRTQAH